MKHLTRKTGAALAVALIVTTAAVAATRNDGVAKSQLNGVPHAVKASDGSLRPGSVGHLQLKNGIIDCEKLVQYLRRLCKPTDPGTGGLPGVPGATGPQGAPGANGAAGAKGTTGAQGVAGPAGAPGDKGDKGAKGDQGLPGLTGPQGPSGPQGTPGAQGIPGVPGAPGVDAPAREYGVATVNVSRGGQPAAAWATYSVLLGSPVGDNTGGIFRFTCTTAQAPCTIRVKAAATGTGATSVYPRVLVYRQDYDAGGPEVYCEYGDGSTGAAPLALTKAAVVNLVDVPVNIGGSADCGGPVATAGDVAVITVPSGYYDVDSTFVFLP